MLFNSGQYLWFLPLVVFAYYLIPQRFRWLLLLAASYYFYMCWRMEYVLLIVGTTLVDFGVGIAISKARERRSKLLLLLASLGLNLGLLFLFKYFDFFSMSLRGAFDLVNITIAAPELKLVLPVGISFYTFQSIAYVVEVYRGNVPAERHLGRFAAYISFFPQLVAGPIERPKHLLPQFKVRHKPNYEAMATGLNLIAFGFFKKVVVADRCAMYVKEVFGTPEQFGAWATGMGIFLFAIQIYCDFSGYSDIAIGSARLMGFDLMQNFDRPYLSRNIAEFWRKWHISLSTWFRDYLYLPLGGQKRSVWRNHFNVFITFLVSGLWHGANWTYVVWGAFHGILLIVDRQFRRKPKTNSEAMPRNALLEWRYWPQISLTFVLVCIGWVFFRAQNLGDAGTLFGNLLDFSQGPSSIIIRAGNQTLGLLNFIILAAALALLFLSGFLPRNMKLRYNLAFLVFVSLVILFFGRNAGNEFIYFQF
jgi:alginate O-acetyltransferase complex protein AlgI